MKEQPDRETELEEVIEKGRDSVHVRYPAVEPGAGAGYEWVGTALWLGGQGGDDRLLAASNRSVCGLIISR
jgi:hypothetical protein